MRVECLAALACVLALVGCGETAEPGKHEDQEYANAMDVGRDAFDLSHPGQAEVQFKVAYDRALLNDDAMALRDAGYNLAVSELDAGDARAALDMTARVRRDIALRVQMSTPALDTVTMAAYVRLGYFRDAMTVGTRIVTEDPALRERIAFLGGLAADGLGEISALKNAVETLNAAIQGQSPKRSSLALADRAELRARLAARQGAYGIAEAQAVDAINLRRDMLDYRGLARALECAAQVARAAGQMGRAAVYSERAAQSRAQAEKQAQAVKKV